MEIRLNILETFLLVFIFLGGWNNFGPNPRRKVGKRIYLLFLVKVEWWKLDLKEKKKKIS